MGHVGVIIEEPIGIHRIETLRNIFHGTIDVLIIGRRDGDSTEYILTINGWEEMEHEAGIGSPGIGSPVSNIPIQFTEKQAQKLVNSLWDSGARAQQAAGSAGQLEATNNHLADMRKIAFQYIRAIDNSRSEDDA